MATFLITFLVHCKDRIQREEVYAVEASTAKAAIEYVQREVVGDAAKLVSVRVA